MSEDDSDSSVQQITGLMTIVEIQMSKEIPNVEWRDDETPFSWIHSMANLSDFAYSSPFFVSGGSSMVR